MALAAVRAALVAAFALLGAGAAALVHRAPAVGAAVGVVAGLAAIALEAAAIRAPLPCLVWGAVGATGGIVGGLSLGAALGTLVPPAAPFASGLAVLGAWVGGAVGVRRAAELPGFRGGGAPAAERILDTSVLIDGRIAEVADAGFLDGALVVPRFVVGELQRLADSGDAVRRNRGRRGFDVLDRLRQAGGVRLTVLDADTGDTEVDDKLVALARARGARLLTNDAALARIAALAGVVVASVNDLALALKPAAVPGETLQVQVVREGKELGQGVGYLDDGTMVVVEGGKRFLGQPLEVVVTSLLQTSAGRMIFTRPRAEESARDA